MPTHFQSNHSKEHLDLEQREVTVLKDLLLLFFKAPSFISSAGCPWDLLVPRRLQFARISQRQQAEQAGTEGPSEILIDLDFLEL